MKRYITFLFCLPLLAFLACEQTVTIDTEANVPQLVVEGLITNSNETDLNYIRLTLSRDFYAGGLAEGITDAEVVVNDNNGNEFRYVHNPLDLPELDGVYLPENPFVGEIGVNYSLSITADGQTYTAQETMEPVTAIESLNIVVNEEEFEDPEDEDRYFEVIFFAQEPQDRIDHYLFKFYRNGEIIKDFEEDIYFSEDEFLGEEIDDLPIAGFYALGDTVDVEMYSITREAFIYYADLFNLLNNDGGMFSPPPANPRTNLSNGALGYFQVSAIDTERIIVTDPREDD